jgi:hypothetical protein
MVTPVKRKFSDSDIFCCKRMRVPGLVTAATAEKRARFSSTDSEEPVKKRLKFDNTIEYLADDENNDIRLVITECVDYEATKPPAVAAVVEPAVARDRKAAERIQQRWRRRARRNRDALVRLNFGDLRLT